MADARRILGERKAGVIFDVGANTGQTCVRLAAAFPGAKVFSFEPFPGSFATLEAECRRLPGVEPVNVALGEQAGELEMFANANSETNSILPATSAAEAWLPSSMIGRVGSVKIAVQTADAFCDERGLARIDLMKIDTQGYELHVLRGAQRMLAQRKVSVINLEVQFVDFYEGQPAFTQLFEHLAAIGMTFVGLYSAAYSSQNRLLWADALFASEEVVGKGSSY
ncbi:MAG TPA: FkbM family methyltransferase [Verrucomicrobiae bacterium]|nr:FkbM family methyltransferase [Verrucomicrobiae bacterium]